MESVKVVKKPHTINKIGKNHSILQQYVQKTCQIRLSLFVYGFITVHVSISLSRRLSAKRAARSGSPSSFKRMIVIDSRTTILDSRIFTS